jgi:hypothetical protein
MIFGDIRLTLDTQVTDLLLSAKVFNLNIWSCTKMFSAPDTEVLNSQNFRPMLRNVICGNLSPNRFGIKFNFFFLSSALKYSLKNLLGMCITMPKQNNLDHKEEGKYS